MNIACFATDEAVHRRVHAALSTEKASCEHFASETALMRACRSRNFDLVIVGPGTVTAVEERVLSWLSCRTDSSTPVLLLSPNTSATHTACVLEAGADDVLTQDVDPAELRARVHSVLRRCARRLVPSTRIDTMGFSLDRESSLCHDRGEPVDLTPREFAMAWLFFCNRGRYLTRGTLSAALWGTNDEVTSRTIEQHVYKVRKKMRLSVDRGVLIRTAYAQGYRLEICGEEQPAATPPPAARETLMHNPHPVAW